MDTVVGIDSLVRQTASMVDNSLSSNSGNQRHMEYLPYPDSHFLDQSSQEDNERCLEEVYLNRNKTFIDGIPIEVTKVDAERIYNPVTEFLNPYLYTITISHGSKFQWTIQKRYKHFHDLHKRLVSYVETETGRSISSLNKSELPNEDETRSLTKKADEQPCFPTHNDRIAFINQSSIIERCKTLQNYLNKLLKHLKLREHVAVREFLEVSPLSFVHGLSRSVKEGAIAKRSNDDFRGRSIFVRAPFVCDKCKFHHGQKWFVLKDSYLVYLTLNSVSVGFPMLIDQRFSLEKGFRKTKTNNGIRLKNLQRSMIIKFEKEDERDFWFDALNTLKGQSSLVAQHPFDSFAPKRNDQYAQWFVNGQSYMEAVAKGILAAKEEIFITDWWLSPEISLIRPNEDGSMRLDNLLGKRAEEGIRVYVMVFKDIQSVVGLNSWHTKLKLTLKSPTKKNIKVIRHPDHSVLPGTESSFLYSHHEKTVVIDQQIAFIGGIDLCWGRWDTDDHRLIDLSDENILELKLPEQLKDEPDIDEAAVDTTKRMAEKNINTFTKTDPDDKTSLLKTNEKPNSNGKSVGPSGVSDLRRELNRTERKLLEEEEEGEIPDQRAKQLGKKVKRIFKKKNRKMDNEDSSDEDEEMPIEEPIDEKPKTIIGVTPVADTKYRYFLGKDYSNSYEKDFEFIEKFDEDYIDRKVSPRMPWHDEALVVTGQAARDCARHFIQRWNVHKAGKFRFIPSYPYILPKSYDDQQLFDQSMLSSILGKDHPVIRVDAQCVRSVSFWSCGTQSTERSIQNAYLHLIDNAQHFIYIENQFFVSIAQDLTIKNGIGDALYRRIVRAHDNGEKFRVYIVLPLLPGFSNVNAVQAVLYFVMRSINKGESSLYQRLIQKGISNPEDYITFYGLRNWDILMGKLVTEIIYVHSKLMIVDDRMCICGSANINDRSLQGSRDSEFCLVINDVEMIDSTLNGHQEQVGQFSSTWRKKIFRQILGLKNDAEMNIDDPCSDEFYNYFRQTAKRNAQLFDEVFNTLPNDRIRTFASTDGYGEIPKLRDTHPLQAHEKCKQIQGFIVEFPLYFLADDVLWPKWNTSEGMAPILLWT